MRALGAAVHVRVVPVWRRLESAVADRIPCAARRGVGADDSGLAGPAAVAVSTGEKGGRTGDLVDDHAGRADLRTDPWRLHRSEEHTSELQSLMRLSYAVLCLKKKNTNKTVIINI